MFSSSEAVLTLKELIDRAGFNQRSLSKISGIPERTINSWVEGEYKPSDVNRLIVLSRTLGVSLKTLLKSFGYSVDGVPDDLVDH